MTSKIKVDNINKVSDDSNIIKKCGTTTTIGSGASNPIVVDGSAVTLGRCGGTVALASGATQTGFGRTGTVDWQTTPKTATFTAVNGEGYFVNTSGGAVTANLPAGSAGAIVAFSDYTRTFTSNNFTIAPNGSEKIGGVADTLVLGVNGQALTLVYVDGTEGWINVQNAEDTETGTVAAYITATGGTISTIGDFKYHKFTGPGTFTVTCAGNAAGSNTVSYVVVAGGGSGGSRNGGSGGGGAGGYREGYNPGSYTASPLATSALPVSASPYPISVGGGGAPQPSCNSAQGNAGSNSIFSSITSTGGGGGGGLSSVGPITGGAPGGSGGGAGIETDNVPFSSAGSGNTPPVSPPQGNPGGNNFATSFPSPSAAGGGGGGAGGAGGNGSSGTGGGRGDGAISGITGSPAARSQGGAAVNYGSPLGGVGGNNPSPATTDDGVPGGTNTGGGGGAAGSGANSGSSGAGGSGIVIIRYKFQ